MRKNSKTDNEKETHCPNDLVLNPRHKHTGGDVLKGNHIFKYSLIEFMVCFDA
jgi:hypothetical protein